MDLRACIALKRWLNSATFLGRPWRWRMRSSAIRSTCFRPGRRALEVFFAAAMRKRRVRDCLELLDRLGRVFEASSSRDPGSGDADPPPNRAGTARSEQRQYSVTGTLVLASSSYAFASTKPRVWAAKAVPMLGTAPGAAYFAGFHRSARTNARLQCM